MSITVLSYQTGLLFKDGLYVRTVGPGRYWRLFGYSIVTVDMRQTQVVAGGQEILTRDHIPIRCSVVIDYRISSAETYFHKSQNPAGQLYVAAQLATRVAVASRDLEAVLGDKGEIGQEVQTAVLGPAERLGFESLGVSIRDITLPGSLKRAYTQAQAARQEGLAALERARGESAALRNLANSTRLLENNPELLALRTLQAIERGSGNILTMNQPLQPGTKTKSDRIVAPNESKEVPE